MSYFADWGKGANTSPRECVYYIHIQHVQIEILAHSHSCSHQYARYAAEAHIFLK